MLTLIAAKWWPAAPGYWLAPDRRLQATLGQSEAEDNAIAEFFGQTVEKIKWAEAAEHFQGEGLQQGIPSLRPAAKALQKLRKQGRTEEANALRAATCGGAAFAERFNEHTACKACRVGPDNPVHRYFLCPAL